MKTTISFIFGALLLLIVKDSAGVQAESNNPATPQSIVTVTCATELYGLASGWANEYNILHPEVNIRVKKTTETNITLKSERNAGIFLYMSGPAPESHELLTTVVGRNVIIPVMHMQNPFRAEFVQKGVSPGMFAEIFSQPEKQVWGTITGNGQSQPLRLYMVNDETTKAGVAEFLKISRIPEESIIFGDNAAILSALQKDPFAIGFCNMTDLASTENQSLAPDVILLPIDRNGNGDLDYMEDIYADVNQLMRGVWIGKYPKPLYKNIIAISNASAAAEAETAFLKWMVTGGQKYLIGAGYSDLVNSEIQSQLNRIDEATIIVPPVQAGNKGLRLILIMVLLLTAAVVITGIAFRRMFFRKSSAEFPAIPVKVFDENSLNVPKGLWFDKNHTWAFMESDGKVKIGIDDFIQHITGHITRVEMKNPGEKIKKGELLLSIVQSGKQLNMYAPVSGTILKQNETLNRISSRMNEVPFTESWVYMVEPSNWFRDIQMLQMADRYEKFLRAEFTRVKDFLASTLKPESMEYAHVVLQDGGQLMEGVLSGFGPEVWEDFQTVFIDQTR